LATSAPVLAADSLGILKAKTLFTDTIVERVSAPYKEWSGGVLITDVYGDFFAEVWCRFNANMRHEGSPWGAKLERWLAHYENGTTPPRASGESKLIHPWRAVFLMRSVAQTLLAETHSDDKIKTFSDANTRAALRVQRSLIASLIRVLDHAPWAAHIIRKFCVHSERKRRRDQVDAQMAAVFLDPTADAVSPSLSRPHCEPRWVERAP